MFILCVIASYLILEENFEIVILVKSYHNSILENKILAFSKKSADEL